LLVRVVRHPYLTAIILRELGIEEREVGAEGQCIANRPLELVLRVIHTNTTAPQ
jgi:hypothetical protein